MYKKYKKIRDLLRENLIIKASAPTPTNSPNLGSFLSPSENISYRELLSNQFLSSNYSCYTIEEELELDSISLYSNDNNKTNIDIYELHSNNNKILVEIIILLYLFTLTLIMEIIKYLFN
jgi:hypothetical protein